MNTDTPHPASATPDSPGPKGVTPPHPSSSSGSLPTSKGTRIILAISAFILVNLVIFSVFFDETVDSDAPLAPAFTTKNFQGEQVSLEGFLGKPLVINFWASTCPPCRKEMPDFQKVYTDLDGQVEFLGLAHNDIKSQAREFIEETLAKEKNVRITYPLALDLDGRIGDAYRLIGLPNTFFLDKEGRIVNAVAGILDEEELRGHLRKSFLDVNI